jgi:hypothetical protein
MINSDLDIKLKFVEMCKLIFINGKGDFVFPIDNLISLVNKDNSILEKDVESEIWEMI